VRSRPYRLTVYSLASDLNSAASDAAVPSFAPYLRGVDFLIL
jgi:hypothetical protein